MAAGVGVTRKDASVQNVLKELYIQTLPIYKKHFYKLSKVFTMIGVDPQSGKDPRQVVEYADGQALSRDFSVAQTLGGTSGVAQTKEALFIFDWDEGCYYVGRMSSKALAASRHDATRLVNVLNRNLKGGVKTMALKRSTDFYRSGRGEIGTVAAVATVGGAANKRLVTFADKRSLFTGIDIDARLVLASALNSATAKTTAVWKVTQLRQAARQVEVELVAGTGSGTNGALATGDLPANGNYIFRQGDITATTPFFNGFESHIPKTLAANDNFGRVNRNVNPLRLAGFVQDRSASTDDGRTILRDFVTAHAEHTETAFDKLICSTSRWDAIADEFQDAVRYNRDVVSHSIGSSDTYVHNVDAILIKAGGYSVPLIADQRVSDTEVWALTPEHWKVGTLYPSLYELAADDGNVIRVPNDQDGIEWRVRSAAQLYCDCYAAQGRVTLPALA